MMQRLGFFARTCSPAEEAASDSSSSLGNDGNPDGLGNCEQKTLSRANVLYGLETPVELLATWCGVFVVELMKVDEGSV